MTATASTLPWTVAGQLACHAGCQLDLASPTGGLTVPGGDRLLGLDLRTPAGDPRLVDHWVRDRDLVGIYEPADPRRLHATAMWRFWEAAETACELIVSAQTSLVESDAAMAVRCDLAAGDLLGGRHGGGRVAWSPLTAVFPPPRLDCLLVRRAADAVLFAVHPADRRRLVPRRDSERLLLECWLFSSLIEKGVLLRSRVIAAIGPAAETAWADSLFGRFAASPPPLTT